MTQSFSTAGPELAPQSSGVHRRKVLITGAAGNIGSYVAEHTHDYYDLRLMVQQPEEGAAIASFGEIVTGDLSDLEALKQLCQGVDTVLHLAADPDPSATWSSLLSNNIIGAYNIFAAAKAAGCRRLIFASSIHAVSGYPPDVQVKTNEPVNPGDLYGVTKCFGEALGRYMAEQEGLSVIALRIGAFQPRDTASAETHASLLDAWVSRRDLTQLIQRCIDAEHLNFAVFHALSNNRYKRLDISDARALVGYQPVDDLFSEQPQLRATAELIERSQTILDGDQQSGIREEV